MRSILLTLTILLVLASSAAGKGNPTFGQISINDSQRLCLADGGVWFHSLQACHINGLWYNPYPYRTYTP
jgi:hypothetical protein